MALVWDGWSAYRDTDTGKFYGPDSVDIDASGEKVLRQGAAAIPNYDPYSYGMAGPTMAEIESLRAAESAKIDPKVKSAVDTLLGLWDSGSGSSGSHQGVIRHHARLLKDDFVANIPSNTSSASEADRLKYAMAILKTGETAQGMFSGKGLNAWNAATSPLINAYKPAATTQWVSTQEGDTIDSRWEQVAPQLGFRGQMYTSVPVERFDEYGNRYQDTETGVSPEFRNFVNQAKSQGYDFVQHADNMVNFNQRYGFRLPSGEVVGQTSVRGDQDVRDFGVSLLPIASMMLGVPGIGGSLATSIGSAILPEATAAAIGSAIGASASTVTSAIGQAAIQSGLTALGGGDTEDILRAGALPIAAPVVSGLVGRGLGAISPPDFDPSLGQLAQPMQDAVQKAITAGTLAEIRGGDFTDAALSALATPVAQAVVPSGLGALEKPAESALTSGALAAIRGQDPVDAALTSAAGSTISAAVPRDLGLLERPLEQALATAAGTAIAGGDVETRFRQALSSAMAGATAEQIGKDFGLSGATSRSILDAAMSGGDMNKMFNAMVATSKDLGRQVNVADAGGVDLTNVYADTSSAGAGSAGSAADSTGNLVGGPADFSVSSSATQKSQLANYIRQQAANGAQGFRVGPGGVLEVEDIDGGLIHRFAPDGAALGSVETVFASRSDRPLATSAAVKDFLTAPYVQSLFEGGAGAGDGAGRYLVPEVTGDGAIGGMQEAGSTYTDQAIRDLEEELAADELMQVNPPVDLPDDRTGAPTRIETSGSVATGGSQQPAMREVTISGRPFFVNDSDGSVYWQDSATGALGYLGKQDFIGSFYPELLPAGPASPTINEPIQYDQSTANDIDRALGNQQNVDVSAPTGVDTSADYGQSVFDQIDLGTYQDPVTQQRLNEMDQQFYLPTQVTSQQAAGLNESQVRQIVADVMAANPSLTAQQVQQIVDSAVQSMPPGLTLQDVSGVVDSAISRLPKAPTAADIDAAIGRATAGMATRADVEQAVRSIQFPEGINQEDVTRAISDYMAQNPGLTAADVAQQVEQQLRQLPTYATPEDVRSTVRSAVADVATKADVQRAIAGIQFPAGLSEADVSRVITDYMRQNPGLSSADVAAQVGQQLKQLPTYATPVDVDAAISRGLTNVATRSDVAEAIRNIQFPAGISEADVTRAITDYMRQNPGLSSQDVAEQVNLQLRQLPTYATPSDVNAAIRGAMTDVATRSDVQKAIAGIQFPAGLTESDVTRAITDYMRQNPGLSPQDVAQQVGDQLRQLPAYATPADVESAIQGAMTNVATRADVEKAIQGIQFPTGISRADVTDVITQYMRDNPGLSAAEVTSLVGQQLKQLPTYATAEDVNTAIRGAMADVATRSDVQAAIAGIQFPAGISRADVTDVITDYMRQNPGLSAAEVTSLVGEQLSRLPAFATPQDVESTVRGALAGYATSEDVAGLGRGLEAVRGDLTQLIADAQASGLRGDAALNASLEALAGELGTTRQGLLRSLGTTESALRSEFASQIGGVQTQMTELGEGLRSAIADARMAGLRGDEALQIGLESLANRLNTTREDLLATLGTNEQSLRSEFASQLGEVSTQIGDVEGRLLDKIAAAQSVGLQGDAALKASLESLAADLGTTQANLLSQMGTNEQALRAQFSAELGGVRGEVGRLGQDLQSAISDAIASGLQGDAALRAGLDALAGDLGTTRTDLLSQLGTTEQALRADLGAQLTGVQSQVTQLGSELSRAIEAARAEGLQGEEALRAGLNSLAGELGTTKDDLLSRLGTSEQALRSDFASQLGGVQSQVTQLGSSLSDAIAEARASGLQGDAALQAGLDTLAGNLGTTRQELLSRLGTSEQALRSDFASQIGGVQSQVSQLGGELSAAIEAARASGLQGDAALQAGLTSLAGELGTTKAGLLSQLGQTEESLRSQFQSAIGGLETGLTGQIGGLRQEVQEQYDMLSAAQQAEVARRVQQGEDLNRAIADVQTGLAGTIGEVEAGLTGQIGGLRQEVQQQYSALSAAQQAEVERRVQQGADLTQAISDVRSGLAGTIAGVEAGLTGQIGGLRQEMSEQYQMLSDAQQAEVQRRISQGENLEAAINAVSSGLGERLSGVETGLTQKIGGIEDRLNDRIDELVNQGVDFQTATNQALQEVTGSFRSLAQQQAEQAQTTQQAIGGVETRLGDRIDQLMQQGVDWQTATEQAISELSGSFSGLAEQTQSSISGLGLDIQSQIEEMQRRSIDAQTASDLATLDRLERMAIRQQESEAAAIAERAAAEERAAQRAAQAAAQSAEESRRSRLMGLASSFASQQGSQAAAADPYKATFLTPYIVGGTAPETFEGPLSGFLKQAMTGDFLPDKPQDQPRQSEDQQMGADQFFSGSNPLDMYQPEQEYQGLFGFRAGGVVPFMAQGGTRYGHNAHGALRVLEHSGKHRVDYRQGDAVTGIGDGQSDDIPAMLADGEFVIPADVVAALGNGSTKAGSDKLYEMMHNIRRHHRSTGPKDLPPPAKAPLEYIKSRKGRSA